MTVIVVEVEFARAGGGSNKRLPLTCPPQVGAPRRVGILSPRAGRGKWRVTNCCPLLVVGKERGGLQAGPVCIAVAGEGVVVILMDY
jgi:hypothetical protein